MDLNKYAILLFGLGTLQKKEVKCMEWITPDFEEFETEAEVTAYADHW
jgi:coenzyme PQQ precursor peptide PqqA